MIQGNVYQYKGLIENSITVVCTVAKVDGHWFGVIPMTYLRVRLERCVGDTKRRIFDEWFGYFSETCIGLKVRCEKIFSMTIRTGFFANNILPEHTSDISVELSGMFSDKFDCKRIGYSWDIGGNANWNGFFPNALNLPVFTYSFEEIAKAEPSNIITVYSRQSSLFPAAEFN